MNEEKVDEKFSKYQERRALAEKEIKEIIFGWAMGEASDEVTIAQVRDLAFSIVRAVNQEQREIVTGAGWPFDADAASVTAQTIVDALNAHITGGTRDKQLNS